MMYSTKKIFFIVIGLLCHLPIVLAGSLELYFQKKLEEKQTVAVINSTHQGWFNQLIDHNNPSLGTFAQRYYIDETYGTSDNSPVFFYICGESSCSSNALNGAIRTYARKYHAKLIALEHRYYGESLPFKSFATDKLKYLTTEAALDDLAYFQRKIRKEHHWVGRWIAFGGSYPGSLSAYYRMKYPYLVAGALASSAPVMAKEDFIEYDAHVTQVAGPVCASQMRQVVSEVEASLGDSNRLEQIKALFEATEVIDPVDFLYLIADTGAAAIQYGMRDEFCNYLAAHETPLLGYAAFAQFIYKSMGVTAVEITAQGAMSEDVNDYNKGVGSRQWYYQSCKEYGYWQNAHPNPSLSSRSALINLDYHRSICKRLFGIAEVTDTTAINNTFYFPMMDELVTNIFFTNGANDPWSNLSLAEKNGNAINSKLSYYLIDGAAHCEDLHRSSANDSEALIKARKTMASLLKVWLQP